MKIAKFVDIPETFEVDGKITATRATLTFEKEDSGRIDDAVLQVNIDCKVIISGQEINFKSHISHKLKKDELDELMKNF